VAARPTLIIVLPALAALAGLLTGALVTAYALRREPPPSELDAPTVHRPVPTARSVLEALPVAVLVVDVADEVWG
jgi:hypothetical protein